MPDWGNQHFANMKHLLKTQQYRLRLMMMHAASCQLQSWAGFPELLLLLLG